MNEEKDKQETAPETEAEPAAEEKPETPAEEKTDKKADKKEEKKDRKFGKKKEDERVSALEAEKEALEKEKAALNDKYLRICAEYDNFRRRSQKEKDNLYSEIRANAVQQFLPVYDNLERALKQGTEDEAYRKGVEMTMNQFLETLKGLGVEPIEALGQTFDPKMHNAVMHTEDPEKGEQEIVQEFQKGFKMGDRVIRFSMVQVAN